MSNTSRDFEDAEGIKDLLEWLVDGKIPIWDLFMGQYISSMGEAAFVLAIGGISTISLLSWTQSWTITSVWAILLGGFFVVLLPPAAASAIAIVVTGMLAVAFYSVIWPRIGSQ
jgi:Na+-transporting NADH:ubiquinone oxidoreductase subunit NqrB